MSTRCYCFWCCFYHVKCCFIFPVCVLCVFNLHTGNEAHNCLLVICLQPRRPVLFVGNHTMFGIYDSPILVHEVLCLLLPAVYFFTGWSAVDPATLINLWICLYSLTQLIFLFNIWWIKHACPFISFMILEYWSFAAVSAGLPVPRTSSPRALDPWCWPDIWKVPLMNSAPGSIMLVSYVFPQDREDGTFWTQQVLCTLCTQVQYDNKTVNYYLSLEVFWSVSMA